MENVHSIPSSPIFKNFDFQSLEFHKKNYA